MTVALAPPPILQFFGNNGLPLVGGSVLTTVGAVNTPTFQDSAGSVPLPNPIPLNSRGEISNSLGTSCQLFLTVGIVYTLTLKDALGNVVDIMTSVGAPDVGIAANLANVASAALGPALVGFNKALVYPPATVGGKLRERVSVLDYGAVCDGNYATGAGTDNTAAFQAAINAMSTSGGGVVYVPGGVLGVANSSFKLVSQITVPDGVSLIGTGKWSSIVFCPTAFANTGGLIRINGAGSNPTNVVGLGVVAQTGGSGGSGIVSVKNGVFISDVWVNGFSTGSGILLSNTDNFLTDFYSELNLTGLTITECAVNVEHGAVYGNGTGVTISNNASVESARVHLTGVRAIQSTTNGFAVSVGKQVSMTGCSASHGNAGLMTNAGLLIDTSSDVVVDGFSAKLGTVSTTSVGIKMTGSSSGVTVSGAKVSGFLDGLSTSACSAVQVTGGTFTSNGRYGINIAGGDQVSITGNNCSNNGTAAAGDAGILSANTANFSVHSLVGNICSGAAQEYGINASLTDSGASSGTTTIVGNNCSLNNTAHINVSGKVANIVMSGNVPEGAVGSGAVVVNTAATYAFGYAEKTLVCNCAATCTVTLPAASISIGRRIRIQTIAAFTVVSASANVVPLIGGAAVTNILAATAGKFADLDSDGTNWRIVGAG